MLFGLSLSHYALMYWANIFLARHLAIDAFDDYSVAVSIVTLLSTLATLGLEKYALRLVSLYIERENWPRLRGFWLFSLRAIVLSAYCCWLASRLGKYWPYRSRFSLRLRFMQAFTDDRALSFDRTYRLRQADTGIGFVSFFSADSVFAAD
jgi:O-antigen/teichoic acid export membrane protein